jgi:hypothetical protein
LVSITFERRGWRTGVTDFSKYSFGVSLAWETGSGGTGWFRRRRESHWEKSLGWALWIGQVWKVSGTVSGSGLITALGLEAYSPWRPALEEA